MSKLLAFILWGALLASSCFAQDATVAPLMRLLQSGRLPKERQPQVLEMVCRRGGPKELAYVFEQALKPDAYDAELRKKILAWLADAAATRKIKPDGDLSAIGALMNADATAKDRALPLAAVRLASLWKVEALTDQLAALARNHNIEPRLRHAAIAGLADVGNAPAKEALSELAKDNAVARI